MDKKAIIDQLEALALDGELSQQDLNYLINYLIANGDLSGTARDMIQIRRGLEQHLPMLAQGELAVTLDTEELFVGGTNGNINISANHWLKGKTVNFIGDSITAEGPGKETYVTQVGELLKCKVNNYGVGGMAFVGDQGFWTVVPQLDVNAAVNVVMGGINDYLLGVPIGTIDHEVDSATNLYVALDKFARALVARCPNAINVMFTPMKADVTQSADAYPQEEVIKAIFYIANKYNFLVVDLYSNAPNLNPNNPTLKARWQPDGIHPNQAYVDTFLTRFVAESLVNLQADGNSLILKKSFCRMLELGADTVLTGQARDLVLFGDAQTTNNNMIGSSHNIKIVKSGIYHVNVHSTIDAASATGNVVAGVGLNGSPFLMGVYDFTNLASEHKVLNLTQMLYLEKGDSLTVKATNNTDKNVDFVTTILTAFEIG